MVKLPVIELSQGFVTMPSADGTHVIKKKKFIQFKKVNFNYKFHITDSLENVRVTTGENRPYGCEYGTPRGTWRILPGDVLYSDEVPLRREEQF